MRISRLRALSLAALVAVSAAVPLAALANDYTDIWWAGEAESGWGVNFVQNENIVFATFYIYDVNRQPTWYSAAMTVTGSGSYAGPLYQTSGSFFGNAWNPAEHPPATLVGSSTFTPSSATAGTLSYTVTNVPGKGTIVVNKPIVRYAFQTILLGGNYAGILSTTFSKCTTSANNGTSVYDIDPQVTQSLNGQLQILVNYTAGGSCTLTGASVQQGQLFSIPTASYTCTFGANTTATVYEVKATSLGIEGRWVALGVDDGKGGTCRQDASFSALLR
jgi:hypothetical protein